MTPNKYVDPDEIKKKDISKSSSPDNSIEVVSVSVQNVRQMIEDKLKNTKKSNSVDRREKDNKQKCRRLC